MAKRVRLNPQGLARRDKGLMSALIPEPGDVFVSADLSTGEPTVTTHYSGDKNYYDACFGMVDKEPYYDVSGLLKIDNLYWSFMSVSPTGRRVVDAAFKSTYGGLSFSRRWRTNGEYAGYGSFADYLRGELKSEYAFHKMAVLGFGYGMGPRKFQSAAYDAGYEVSFSEAKGLFNTYWTLFPGLKAFAKRCETELEKNGYLVNDFGYRLLPDKGYKAFNYFIQSSVSGIMHVLCAQFFARAPYCTFLFVIHDEIIFSCARERVEEARQAMVASEEALNQMLNWRVRIRVGFKQGDNLYEAK